MGMNEVMKEMMGPEVYEMFGIPDDAEETMYVATVPDKNSGAGVIAYQDFMDQAAERVGGDFFVLPSSINEILLVPDNGDMTADALRDMVKDVNAKEVSPEERLSDNVYHYDSKDHVFELAEKFEARLAPFDIKELRDLTAYDELELDTLGDEKTALFLIMSDTDGTFNFLISMIYTQMFNLLCVRPFLSDKYDLTQHPNYKLTADYDKRNYFDVVKFLSHNLILKADDEYQVIDVTE